MGRKLFQLCEFKILTVFGCGGIHKNSTGELSNRVDHADVFSHDSSITCTWVIIAGDGQFQVVELYSVDITEIEGPSYNHMEVKVNCTVKPV